MDHYGAVQTGIARSSFPGTIRGSVSAVLGPVVYCRLPRATIGDICLIERRSNRPITAQVIGFREELITLAPLDEPDDIGAGSAVINTARPLELKLELPLEGRVFDAMGNDIDPGGSCHLAHRGSFITLNPYQSAPAALDRAPISQIFESGVKVIDNFCTIGHGQRLGLFAAAGSGKSSLLAMLAQNSPADLNVIGLIGERGREVSDFLSRMNDHQIRARSIFVVATSDESPQRRRLAAFTATALAEHFRSQGKRVLLLVDSLTRTARAIREMGLAAGEIPIRQGYTPSVYTTLPKLLERSGNDRHGSITAVYAVLTNRGEDDPLEEEIKSLLDGHIKLREEIALEGIRPAVDLLGSISRLMHALHSPQHLEDVRLVHRLMHRLKKDRDLVLFGGAPDGELRCALKYESALKTFLHQGLDEVCTRLAGQQAIHGLCADIRAELADQAQGIPQHVVGDTKSL